MARWTSKKARTSPFIPVMRELVRCYQAFTLFDARLFRERDLTSSQGDVLFTLGNTEGMTCKELGEKTLITKGTLTGVLDRMEAKGLLERRQSAEDGRSYIVTLTRKGAELFERVYPEHVAVLRDRFARLPQAELERTRDVLARLRASFD